MVYVQNCQIKTKKTFKRLKLLRAFRQMKSPRRRNVTGPPLSGPISHISRYELRSSAQLSSENIEITKGKMSSEKIKIFSKNSILCSFDVLKPMLLQQPFSSTTMRQKAASRLP